MALGGALVVILALVAPAAAAPPHNPFVGSWEGTYDAPQSPVGATEIHIAIGGNGHLAGAVDIGGTCFLMFGDEMRSSFSGSGSIVSEAPYLFEATATIYCHTRDGQGRQVAVDDFYLLFEYLPDSDTLKALHFPPEAVSDCAWRSGSDASVCP